MIMRRGDKLFILLHILMLSHTQASHGRGPLELIEPGKLYVATSGEFSPFSFINKNNQLDGLEVRLMKEVCRRLNLEYKTVILSWEAIILGLFSEQSMEPTLYDIATESMDITPEREKKVQFIPWLESGGAIVTLEKNKDINYPEDIKGKNIGTVLSSTWEKYAKQYAVKNIQYYQSENSALVSLGEGKVDAVITDELNAQYFKKKHNRDIKILPFALSRLTKGWAIKKDKTSLYEAINDTLKKMISDGTYALIVKEYVDHDPSPYPHKN